MSSIIYGHTGETAPQPAGEPPLPGLRTLTVPTGSGAIFAARSGHVSDVKQQVTVQVDLQVVGKVDEAHLLRYEQLETIRMLTNHNLDADSPLACLLIGQPTLRRTMKLAVLAALEQRTALRYAMPPMTSAETSSYISHHLKLAGRSDPLFSDDAATLIHTTSRGYPRAVNNLSIQALVATYAAGKTIVDEQAARAAVTEVTDT
jgi:type II secretory pathway predicted ATPase ExeA